MKRMKSILSVAAAVAVMAACATSQAGVTVGIGVGGRPIPTITTTIIPMDMGFMSRRAPSITHRRPRTMPRPRSM